MVAKNPKSTTAPGIDAHRASLPSFGFIKVGITNVGFSRQKSRIFISQSV
jgi:hypothetical protein